LFYGNITGFEPDFSNPGTKISPYYESYVRSNYDLEEFYEVRNHLVTLALRLNPLPNISYVEITLEPG